MLPNNNLSSNNNQDLVHLCQFIGNLDISLRAIQILVERNPLLVHQKNSNGYTPLLVAAACGREDAVSYLLWKGARVNAEFASNDGSTPLGWAKAGNHQRVIELLEDREKEAFPELCHAAQEGDMDKVRFLVSEYPDLLKRSTTELSLTPLHLAAASLQTEVVRYLLANGADVNRLVPYSTPEGKVVWRTPLDLCDPKTSPVVALCLRNNGGKTSKELQSDRLNDACICGNLETVTEIIEEHPDLIDQPDGHGYMNPLLWAAAKGHEPVVSYLLQKGANPDVRVNCPGNEHHDKTALQFVKDHQARVALWLDREKAKAKQDADNFIGQFKGPGFEYAIRPYLVEGRDNGYWPKEETQIKIQLLNYIIRRGRESEYTPSLFGYKFESDWGIWGLAGRSKTQKLDTARELKGIVLGEFDSNALEKFYQSHQADLKPNSQLGKIFLALKNETASRNRPSVPGRGH